MTTSELGSIPYLSKEIKLYDSQLAALDREQKKAVIPARMRTQYDTAVQEYRQALIESREKRMQELTVLQDFIGNIPDPFTQAIFTARFIENKSWWEVADSVSGYGKYNSGSIKMACYRWLEKYNISTGAA